MKQLILIPVLLLAAACGTRLNTLDARAVTNQLRACSAIDERTDGGPVAALAEACVCGAKGILVRAGQPLPEAGLEYCP
jgi:hypothetical protein